MKSNDPMRIAEMTLSANGVELYVRGQNLDAEELSAIVARMVATLAWVSQAKTYDGRRTWSNLEEFVQNGAS